MKIVFLGTPDFAVASLRALVEAGHDVVAVVTAPDKPAGRGLKMQQSAVKEYAVVAGLKVLQPQRLKDPEFLEELHALKPDLGIVIAFRMLPEVVWAAPRLGTFNLHASLLPQYRGAAPINWAVINGETMTGVTTFFLNSEIDKGAILGRREVAITPDDTAGTLHDKLMNVGAQLVLETVKNIADGTAVAHEQPLDDSNLKPAPKIFRDDCRIDWNRTMAELHNFVRGLSPYPAAWSTLGGGETVKIFKVRPVEPSQESASGSSLCGHALPGTTHSDGRTFLHIACADGWLAIEELQLAGKKHMPIEDFLRGWIPPQR
jgi:methionyl-tRNA formyltransferase